MAEQIYSALMIVRRKQVERLTGLSRSSIYARVRARTFPASVRLGGNSVGWYLGDIEAFLADPANYRAEEK
jgi:prophage regulatory protein